MDFPRLTEKEEELMHIFWDTDVPLTSNEILASSKEHSWKDSYLQIMLRSLESKGMLEVVGQVRYRTQYARQLRSTMSCEEYYVRLAYSRGVNPVKFVTLIKETFDENG